MKLIFSLGFFISLSAFAQKPVADIVCKNNQNQTQFSISTKSGKVWYNNSVSVEGPVFSGVYSTKNYTGEILGEIEVDDQSFYITLIMRSVNSKPQLEAIWYPRANQYVSTRYFLNDCQLN